MLSKLLLLAGLVAAAHATGITSPNEAATDAVVPETPELRGSQLAQQVSELLERRARNEAPGSEMLETLMGKGHNNNPNPTLLKAELAADPGVIPKVPGQNAPPSPGPCKANVIISVTESGDDSKIEIKDFEWQGSSEQQANCGSLDTKFIGAHIHKAPATANGPIVVGFCGGSDQGSTLPPFSGSCSSFLNSFQGDGTIPGKACNLGKSSPCINDKTDNKIADVAKEIVANPLDYYFNLHTHDSYVASKGHALGMLRGQLQSPGSAAVHWLEEPRK